MTLYNTITRLCKAFVNSSSANTKLSKTQLYKTGLVGRLLESLLKTGSPLMKKFT